jgi:hypothetical protein
MYTPRRRHPQSSRLCISLTTNTFNRLENCIFAKNYLQSLKTVDFLRGHAHTLIPSPQTSTSTLNFQIITTPIPTTMAPTEEE